MQEYIIERMKILAALSDHRLTISELKEATGLHESALEKYLKMMTNMKLVKESRFYIRKDRVKYIATRRGKRMLNLYLQYLKKVIRELNTMMEQRMNVFSSTSMMHHWDQR